MRKSVLYLFFTMIFLTACATPDNADNQKEELGTHPMHYESEAERKDREQLREKTIGENGGYPQSKQLHLKQIDRSKEYTNPYTNAESLMLTEELNKLDYIAAVEVASTKDTIMVGVMLKDIDSHKHFSEERFSDRIENEVRQILPNTQKKIIISTLNSEWGKQKNINSRIQSPN